MVTPDLSSLFNVYLGPFETSTVLAVGMYCVGDPPVAPILTQLSPPPTDNHVTATVDTQYPFSDVLTTTIVADQPFTYKVRIPSWVEGGTIAVNGAPAKPVSPVNGLQSVEISAGKTVLVLDLPAPITVGAYLMRTSPSTSGASSRLFGASIPSMEYQYFTEY